MRDIRRHKERGRCGKKGGKGLGRPARFVPGTPENRPSLDGMANYATYVGTGEPADFVNLRKRLKVKLRTRLRGLLKAASGQPRIFVNNPRKGIHFRGQ